MSTSMERVDGTHGTRTWYPRQCRQKLLFETAANVSSLRCLMNASTRTPAGRHAEKPLMYGHVRDFNEHSLPQDPGEL